MRKTKSAVVHFPQKDHTTCFLSWQDQTSKHCSSRYFDLLRRLARVSGGDRPEDLYDERLPPGLRASVAAPEADPDQVGELCYERGLVNIE